MVMTSSFTFPPTFPPTALSAAAGAAAGIKHTPPLHLPRLLIRDHRKMQRLRHLQRRQAHLPPQPPVPPIQRHDGQQRHGHQFHTHPQNDPVRLIHGMVHLILARVRRIRGGDTRRQHLVRMIRHFVRIVAPGVVGNLALRDRDAAAEHDVADVVEQLVHRARVRVVQVLVVAGAGGEAGVGGREGARHRDVGAEVGHVALERDGRLEQVGEGERDAAEGAVRVGRLGERVLDDAVVIGDRERGDHLVDVEGRFVGDARVDFPLYAVHRWAEGDGLLGDVDGVFHTRWYEGAVTLRDDLTGGTFFVLPERVHGD